MFACDGRQARKNKGKVPIFAQVIEQGKKEAVFHVEYPVETVQFLLAVSHEKKLSALDSFENLAIIGTSFPYL
jgi:hypothetical protein